MEPLDTLKQ